jgi:hypothetical protein
MIKNFTKKMANVILVINERFDELDDYKKIYTWFGLLGIGLIVFGAGGTFFFGLGFASVRFLHLRGMWTKWSPELWDSGIVEAPENCDDIKCEECDL